MFPQTLQYGRLDREESERIIYSLISSCRRRESAIGRFQRKERDVVSVALEVRVDTSKRNCPLCNPMACNGSSYSIVTPLRVINQKVRISENGSDRPVIMSKLEYVAAAERGEEPDMPVMCAKGSQEVLLSFNVQGREFEVYSGLPLGGRKSSFVSAIPAKHIHRLQVYLNGNP